MSHGRFAPSPTGPLHLGNLRTALVAWLAARSGGGEFTVRMEDLDRVTSSQEHATGQLADLAAIGLDWDGDVVFQSERFPRYLAAIDRLNEEGLTYPCYCTRREIRSPDARALAKPDYVLILPWNLEAEIVQQLSEIAAWGGRFVVPIPRAHRRARGDGRRAAYCGARGPFWVSRSSALMSWSLRRRRSS